MERDTRFELAPSAWKADMLAAGHQSRKLEHDYLYTAVSSCLPRLVPLKNPTSKRRRPYMVDLRRLELLTF